MANLNSATDPDPEPTAAKTLMSRRETITGAAKGAAQFIGVEDCHRAKGSAYRLGRRRRRRGQVWRYTPRGLKHGVLTLLYESTSEKHLDAPDAITVSPRGGEIGRSEWAGSRPRAKRHPANPVV